MSNKILLAPADYVKTLIKYPVLSLIWITWVAVFLLLVLAQVSPGVQNSLNNAAKGVGISLVTDTLSSAAESSSTELEENATKLQAALDENSALKVEFTTVNKQLNEALDLLTDLEKNDQSSQSENTQLAKQNKALNNELKAIESKLASSQTTLANTEQKYQLTLMENKNLLKESQVTKENLNKAEAQISTLLAEIDNLKQATPAAEEATETPASSQNGASPAATETTETPATTDNSESPAAESTEELIEPSSIDAVSQPEVIPSESADLEASTDNTSTEEAVSAP